MYSQYERLRIHVWARDVAVVRLCYTRLARPIRRSHEPRIRKLRKAFYREMLGWHHGCQKLCRKYRL